MNENKIGINIENENERVKNAIYSSKFMMNKDLFYEFCSVSYNAIKKKLLIYLCLVIAAIGINFLLGNYEIVLGFSIAIIFLMILVYFRTRKAMKVNYDIDLILMKNENIRHIDCFEDKIISQVDESKREFLYHQITKFFETKNFILLHLQHNLYIALEKNNLNANVDEVKSFLIEKCTVVKKKKFINCSNDKKWFLVFLIASIVISIVGIISVLILTSNFF